MKQKMLVTGASGMLGGTLVRYFSPVFEVYASSGQSELPYAEKHLTFDLNRNDYEVLLEWAQPDIIIHSAALTNGNLCDRNPEIALKTNALSLNKIALGAKPETRIIHISTDAVFSSRAHNSNENDFAGSDSVYGKSKELGEFFLQLRSQNFTIIRTTIVGVNQLEGRQGFAEWIVKSAREKERIGLFDDVFFTPICCSTLARIIFKILQNGYFINEKVHIGASEIYSKYNFGISLLKELGLGTDQIEKSKITNFSGRAKRATDQSLNSSYFEKVTGIRLPGLIETVKQLKKDFDE